MSMSVPKTLCIVVREEKSFQLTTKIVNRTRRISRVESGNEFQAAGPATEKARRPNWLPSFLRT